MEKETGTIQADGPRYLINALVYKTTKSSIYCVRLKKIEKFNLPGKKRQAGPVHI